MFVKAKYYVSATKSGVFSTPECLYSEEVRVLEIFPRKRNFTQTKFLLNILQYFVNFFLSQTNDNNKKQKLDGY